MFTCTFCSKDVDYCWTYCLGDHDHTNDSMSPDKTHVVMCETCEKLVFSILDQDRKEHTQCAK